MPRWTPEARKQQAEAIRGWSPWAKSTGPRTAEGRARSSRNAWKGGVRKKVARLGDALRRLAARTQEVISSFRRKHTFRRPRSLPAPASFFDPEAVFNGGDEDEEEGPDAIDRMPIGEVMARLGRLNHQPSF